AEDGIRDGHVTGVQTCALPILSAAERHVFPFPAPTRSLGREHSARAGRATLARDRDAERRFGTPDASGAGDDVPRRRPSTHGLDCGPLWGPPDRGGLLRL